jgi:glycosyltransferase involved in cell wall biosynthesis
MRHLFLLSMAGGYGGAEKSLELIARELQHELRLTIFACNPLHLAALRHVLTPPAHLVELPSVDTTEGFLAVGHALLRACHASMPDALLINTQRSAQIAAAVAARIPAVAARSFVYVRDFQWPSFDFLGELLPSAHVLVPSPALIERGDYLAPHLAPAGRLSWSVVPDMTDLPLEAGDMPADGPILHLAAYNRFKGREHLIRAAALLKRSGRVLPVLSLGMPDDPRLPDELRQMIDAEGLAQSVTLGAYSDDVPSLLRRSSAVAVTSISQFGGPETFGRSVIEAWAFGLPVAAFAAGGPKYLIEDGVDGLLVEEANDQALAEALWRLYADRTLRTRLGKAGRAKVERDYATPKVVGRLLAAMEDRLTRAIGAARP